LTLFVFFDVQILRTDGPNLVRFLAQNRGWISLIYWVTVRVGAACRVELCKNSIFTGGVASRTLSSQHPGLRFTKILRGLRGLRLPLTPRRARNQQPRNRACSETTSLKLGMVIFSSCAGAREARFFNSAAEIRNGRLVRDQRG